MTDAPHEETTTARDRLTRNARAVIVGTVGFCLVVFVGAAWRDEQRASEARNLTVSVDRLTTTVADLSAALSQRTVTIDVLGQFVDRLDCQQAQQVVFSRTIAALLQTAVDDRVTTAEGQALFGLLFTAFDDDPRRPGTQPCPAVTITLDPLPTKGTNP